MPTPGISRPRQPGGAGHEPEPQRRASDHRRGTEPSRRAQPTGGHGHRGLQHGPGPDAAGCRQDDRPAGRPRPAADQGRRPAQPDRRYGALRLHRAPAASRPVRRSWWRSDRASSSTRSPRPPSSSTSRPGCSPSSPSSRTSSGSRSSRPPASWPRSPRTRRSWPATRPPSRRRSRQPRPCSATLKEKARLRVLARQRAAAQAILTAPSRDTSGRRVAPGRPASAHAGAHTAGQRTGGDRRSDRAGAARQALRLRRGRTQLVRLLRSDHVLVGRGRGVPVARVLGPVRPGRAGRRSPPCSPVTWCSTTRRSPTSACTSATARSSTRRIPALRGDRAALLDADLLGTSRRLTPVFTAVALVAVAAAAVGFSRLDEAFATRDDVGTQRRTASTGPAASGGATSIAGRAAQPGRCRVRSRPGRLPRRLGTWRHGSAAGLADLRQPGRTSGSRASRRGCRCRACASHAATWTARVDVAWRLSGRDAPTSTATSALRYTLRGDATADLVISQISRLPGGREPVWLLPGLEVRRGPRTLVAAGSPGAAQRVERLLREAVVAVGSGAADLAR